MKYVRDIIACKGQDVWSISSDEFVYDALKEMARHDVGAVVVTDAGKYLGVFSERDYARKVVLKGRASWQTPVKDVMQINLPQVQPDTDLNECMQIMTTRRARYLPVFEEGFICLISMGDVVHALINEKDFLIKQLEYYIVGFQHSV